MPLRIIEFNQCMQLWLPAAYGETLSFTIDYVGNDSVLDWLLGFVGVGRGVVPTISEQLNTYYNMYRTYSSDERDRERR